MSVEEIVAKIVNLALDCGENSVWTNEANEKLHDLVWVLRQTCVSEASIGVLNVECDNLRDVMVRLVPRHNKATIEWTRKSQYMDGDYDLIPKEIHEAVVDAAAKTQRG